MYKIYRNMVSDYLNYIIPKIRYDGSMYVPDNHKTIVFQNIG